MELRRSRLVVPWEPLVVKALVEAPHKHRW